MGDANNPSCHDHKLVRAIAPAPQHLDLAEVRARLAGQAGPRYWRSLEELAATPGFEEMLYREFPAFASEWRESFSRRDFLKLAGASLALAGLAGCTKQPLEPIVPYVRQPEELVLGKPLFFSTAMTVAGIAKPLLVESHEGRPTKVEGNPEHPASGGAADPWAQASILGLYDPDRSQTITYLGQVRPWGAAVTAIKRALEAQRASQGAGLRFLTGAVTSPTLAAQLRGILQRYPAAKWHQWEPAHRDHARAAAVMAFGQPVTPHYQMARADVVLSLDADFMSPAGHPDFIRLSRDFISRRREPGGGMNRLYAVESSPTNTGGKADHRMRVRASEVETVARDIAARLGIGVPSTPAAPRQKFVEAVVKDLQAHRGRSLVIAGDHQPPEVHALALAMNQALGNAGATVVYTDPIEAEPVDHTQSLRELVREMSAGQVNMLVVLGSNPVYTAPADLGFLDAFNKVALRVHLGLYDDETSAYCHWHVPETHYLEHWSDARSWDGTVSIVQPLIAPLYNGKSPHELLAVFTDRTEQSGYDIVRSYWQAQRPDPDFESFWRRALHDGFIPGTAAPPRQVTARSLALGPEKPAIQGVELDFRPDPSVFDGRFANNAWLQELPKPLTKLTWDNAVLVSVGLAEQQGLRDRDVVELEHRGRKVRGAVIIQPGHPDECVTVHLGYGRQRGGQNCPGRGFDAYQLRTSDAPWFAGGVRLAKTGDVLPLAVTQGHFNMEGRELVRAATLEEFQKDPHFAHHDHHEPDEHMTMYPAFPYEGYKWGMVIDVNSCIGCNACVQACQAENNIPVVGKEQVLRSREMHWLRVDAYYEGPVENPAAYFQPVPCMHCENAPCELVCPVGATVHSSEGLNDMVYNRCVGTRYCSNNCPYKVRRFNFLLFQDWSTPSLEMMRNPDVSVRSRGVMEKCTYCVQRINRSRVEAEVQDRRIQDGEVQTACQQACPTQAIIFGDLNDPKSKIARLARDPRNYGLLADLNTRPRTTYLAEVRNPSPGLGGAEKES